jgi:glycosyltransferase involved in cell wall biosynthesis
VKICYIISDINKAIAFEWIANSFREQGVELSFVLINPGPSALEDFLQANKFQAFRITCRGKKDWPRVLFRTRQLLREWRPDIIHCHLLTASILGLIAARSAGIRDRIYTRHHSSLHHVYFRKGIFWDKLTNLMATRVVAISGVVRSILIDWEGVQASKIVLIPHGFRLKDFAPADPAMRTVWRAKNGIPAGVTVVGVVSRLTEWKGVQYIIPAFRDFLLQDPDAVLLLFNARGDYARPLQDQLALLPTGSFRAIEFEEDMASAYAAMDLFIHVPIDEHSEAFGQIYVEALAAGKPSIFTLSGIAPNFIRDGENALIVPFCDSEAIYSALTRLLEDKSLRVRLSKNGPESVKERFDLPVMINALDNLYQQCLCP